MTKHFNYLYLLSQETFDLQTKSEKIFLPYHTLQKPTIYKKNNFEYSDLTDSEYVNLCNILINNQHCFAKHKIDVGKISTP